MGLVGGQVARRRVHAEDPLIYTRLSAAYLGKALGNLLCTCFGVSVLLEIAGLGGKKRLPVL